MVRDLAQVLFQGAFVTLIVGAAQFACDSRLGRSELPGLGAHLGVAAWTRAVPLGEGGSVCSALRVLTGAGRSLFQHVYCRLSRVHTANDRSPGHHEGQPLGQVGFVLLRLCDELRHRVTFLVQKDFLLFSKGVS